MIVAWVIGVVVGILIGAPVGALIFLKALGHHRRPQNVDYKERWQAAVALLGAEGRLTKEQVKQISAPGFPVPPAEQVQQAATRVQRGRGATANSSRTRAPQRRMATWDRKDVEIERARAGLPPADDLEGMASWDIKAVLQARARYRTDGTGN